jgi:hypothetical protein
MNESRVNLCISFTGGGGKNGQGMKPTTHLQLVLIVKNVFSYTSPCPTRIHVVQRDKFTSNLPNNIKLTFNLPENDEWRANESITVPLKGTR